MKDEALLLFFPVKRTDILSLKMDTIQLSRKWLLGDVFRKGGFGVVHLGRSDADESVVIKLVPKEPGAARELLFQSVESTPNIIPILDVGEWNDYYVIVMPQAMRSLRDYLDGSATTLPIEESVSILSNIAEALAGLEGAIVHRDLKPENILLLNESWCLADFGIARYAEATTSLHTHRFSMTPPYAAPEQWNNERPTPATDVYAFGVMAYEILAGNRPFPGPSTSDYREQHLYQMPPVLVGVPPTLASLVNECLYKPAEGRPTAANIAARLQASQKPVSAAFGRLQHVNAIVVTRAAQESARLAAAQTREERRRALLTVAGDSFDNLAFTLEQTIAEAAPTVDVRRPAGRPVVLRLESAELEMDILRPSDFNCLAEEGETAPFDVIAFSAVAVHMHDELNGDVVRAHSLWFCDAQEEGVYRWYELAFARVGWEDTTDFVAPNALSPTTAHASRCFVGREGAYSLAREPAPIDQGEEGQFIERWMDWFAQAAENDLRRPKILPEESGGWHRGNIAS